MSVFGKVMALPWLSTSFAVGRYSLLRCAASSTTMLVKPVISSTCDVTVTPSMKSSNLR